jgi:hypothetical protein
MHSTWDIEQSIMATQESVEYGEGNLQAIKEKYVNVNKSLFRSFQCHPVQKWGRKHCIRKVLFLQNLLPILLPFLDYPWLKNNLCNIKSFREDVLA